MTFTAEEHERVLKAAGFEESLDYSHGDKIVDGWIDPYGEWLDNGEYDLSQDDLAAKYLLPVIFSDDENIVCGATFGEALFKFVLALLDAGVVPEVPE